MNLYATCCDQCGAAVTKYTLVINTETAGTRAFEAWCFTCITEAGNEQ